MQIKSNGPTDQDMFEEIKGNIIKTQYFRKNPGKEFDPLKTKIQKEKKKYLESLTLTGYVTLTTITGLSATIINTITDNNLVNKLTQLASQNNVEMIQRGLECVMNPETSFLYAIPLATVLVTTIQARYELAQKDSLLSKIFNLQTHYSSQKNNPLIENGNPLDLIELLHLN
jgi:hypothetical protein